MQCAHSRSSSKLSAHYGNSVLAQAFRAKNAAMRAKFDLKLHFMREFLKTPVRSATLCERRRRTLPSAPAIGEVCPCEPVKWHASGCRGSAQVQPEGQERRVALLREYTGVEADEGARATEEGSAEVAPAAQTQHGVRGQLSAVWRHRLSAREFQELRAASFPMQVVIIPASAAQSFPIRITLQRSFSILYFPSFVNVIRRWTADFSVFC